jgi:hypothetical protein
LGCSALSARLSGCSPVCICLAERGRGAMTLSLSVGRDYRMSVRYEYVIFEDEEIVARQGYFANSGKARREGLKKAREIYAERARIAPELDL